jgi:hypothetical protein
MRFGWVLLAACSGPSPHAPANRVTGIPEHELVVAHGREVRFARTTPTGLVVTRTVGLPATVGELEWIGAEPVVMLRAQFDEVDRSHDGEVARITARGYEPFATLPAKTWEVPKPADGEKVEPKWRLVVGPAGEVWQGRCEWGGIQDGGWCDQWVYARRAPEPMTIAREQPKPAPVRNPPMISPSQTTTVKLVDAPGDSQSVKVLRCSNGASSVDYPPATARDGYIGISEPVWITTDPPMYQVIKTSAGYTAIDEPVMFEGCSESQHYTHASIEAGPGDLVAIYGGDQMSVRWRGRELGTLADVSLVRFAPPR